MIRLMPLLRILTKQQIFMRSKIIFFVLCFCCTTVIAQEYKTWKSFGIEGIYEKVELDRGTLGEDGRKINYVFVPAELKQGKYDVQIVDYKNDLYEIKGTTYYIKFTFWPGSFGYIGKSGVLEIGISLFSSKLYLKP